MKKLLISVLLGAAVLSAVPVLAADGSKVALLDREAALLASNAARTAQEKLNGDMKPQRDRLDQLRNDIKAMEQRFQKEGATMSEINKKKLRDQADKKAQEFNVLVQQVQERTQQAQQDLLKRMLPTLEIILEDLRKSGGYDIILDRRSAIYVAPELDLTKRVIDRLNAGK
jgi:Skp family chaperone for outer membrane proteins